jgi:hypothetical protein
LKVKRLGENSPKAGFFGRLRCNASGIRSARINPELGDKRKKKQKKAGNAGFLSITKNVTRY